jgi:hypothetical protein
MTAPPRPTEIAIPVDLLSQAHFGLQLAVDHAGSPELEERFRQVRREIAQLIRAWVIGVASGSDPNIHPLDEAR